MNNVEYQSQFSKDMYTFVEEMRAMGHKYETGARQLKRLDSFIIDNYCDEVCLNKAIVQSWTKKTPYESLSTQLGRISVIRGFARYLCRIGNSAYVYPPLHHKIERYNYVPYIFTPAQICDLLTVFFTA